MFSPITIPFGAKMLFNSVTLKPGVTFDDVELAVGEMCSVVKDTYGGDKGGFIAGRCSNFQASCPRKAHSVHQGTPASIM